MVSLSLRVQSLSLSPKVSSLILSKRLIDHSHLFSFIFLFISEFLGVALQFFGNDGFSIIITFYVFCDFFCGLLSHPWQRLSGF